MVRGNRKEVKISPLFILFLALALIVVPVYSLAVLSLDKADYVTYDSITKEPTWLLWVSLSGYGESIVGQTFTADEIQQKNVGDERPLYDLRIDMSVNTQYCQYPIILRNDYVQRLNYEYRNLPLGIGAGDFEQYCNNKLQDPTVSQIWFIKMPYSWDYYCVWKYKWKNLGDVGTATLKFSATIKATVGSDTRTAQIGTTELTQKSVWIGDKVYVAWTGNLVSGETCPNSGDYHIMAVYDPNRGWDTVDSINVQNYLSFDSGFNFESCVNTYHDVPYCVNSYNSKSEQAVAHKDFSYYENGQYLGTAVPQGNQLIMNLPKALQYPTFLMRVKASWIGVELTCGRPQITQINSPIDVQNGRQAYISGKVKNVGSYSGVFSATVSCNDNRFFVVGTIPDYNIPAGQETSFSIPISTSVTTKTSTTCTVTFYDKTCPDRTSSAQVTVNGYPPSVCKDGELQCYGNAIQKCINGQWQNVQYCSYMCTYVNGVPTCSTPEDRDGDGIPDSMDKCPDQAGPLENDGCPPIQPCAWWDIACHWKNFVNWVMEKAKNFLSLVGLIVLAIIGIYLIIKILK